MVDWSVGADKWYYKSRANTRVVGREIAKLIEDLNAATGAGFGSMHIIGHSLGAHIGGYAGEACLGTIGRVTGIYLTSQSFLSGHHIIETLLCFPASFCFFVFPLEIMFMYVCILSMDFVIITQEVYLKRYILGEGEIQTIGTREKIGR